MISDLKYGNVLKKLLVTWSLCYGMITLLVIMGYWLPHQWMPVAAVLCTIPLFAYANNNLYYGHAHCSLLVRYSGFSLLWSALAMFILNLINSHWLKLTDYQFSNPHNPYVVSLIVYPVSAVVYLIGYLRYGHTKYCKDCRARGGYSINSILEYNVFRNEAKYLNRFTFIVTFCLAAVSIVYFSVYYISVNINGPDTFFLFIIPVVVYGLSIVYISMRYMNLHFEVTITTNQMRAEYDTMVRFLIVRKDKILLSEMEVNKTPTGLWDTPAQSEIPFEDSIDEEQTRKIFTKLSGLDKYDLKQLFVTKTNHHNAFHYAVFLPDEDEEMGRLQGEWCNLYDYNVMLKAGLIARPFAYEMHRIYTMTMAWKTYDADGNRLYPIKNYRPTFRISDFKNWDLDYNDMHWLNVAANNEDRPFFRFRRFWNRYITGYDRRWNQKSS